MKHVAHRDEQPVTGIGVGMSVGAGAAIGLALIASSASIAEFVATAAVYGFFAGIVYDLARTFVACRKPPFRR
jgi:hypothetical protein